MSALVVFRALVVSGAMLAASHIYIPINRAHGAESPEAQAGFRIAHDVCARCHQVDWQPVPRAAAPGKPPDFAWVARTHPGYLDGVLVRPPHAMWGVDISPAQANSLKAYFMTLTTPTKSPAP